VTCGFAQNTFYEYYTAAGGDSSQAATIQVWSPTTKRYYSENCTSSGDAVDCIFGSGNQVRLTASGLLAYSQAQADSYAQSHDLGPNG
jgi:pectin methylesterase-like acyl-CoA thioesterase